MKSLWKRLLYKIGWYEAFLTPDGAKLLAYLNGVMENKRQPYNERYEMLLDDGSGRDRYEVAEELIKALEGARK